ncbi:DoxX family membrane protein [Halorussus marinus]|uniref:DoxX family membrane protein n=1 Tax=Halorussus marinus TaxID=2505976 RepID=UPI001091A8FD|nr:DoxX family membrane protein [Halorussus marinus]
MSTSDGSSVLESVADRAARALPPSPTLARWGLGGMLLAAGVHKLLNPGAWAVYVVDWLAPLLVVSPVAFMLVNGWLEIGFALLLVADRYTGVAASVAAASLTATIGYLAVVWATSGRFGDVIARDVGLLGLALAVLADALRGE